MFKINWKKTWSDMSETIFKHPVEILIMVFWFILFLLFKGQEEVFGNNDTLLYIVPFATVGAYVLGVLAPKGPFRIFYYVVPVLATAVMFLFNWKPFLDTSYAITIFLFLALMVAAHRKMDNEAFARNVLQLVMSGIFAFVIAIAFFLMSFAIYQSISYIFDVVWMQSNESDFIEIFLALSLGVLFTYSFLFFSSTRPAESFKGAKVVDVLFNYILTPALIIYTVILYVYIFKILLTWDLPIGGVSYMVFFFIICALIVKLCQPLLTKRPFTAFLDKFSFIALAPLVLFWIGTARRISEFGLTEARVYLLACGLLATIYVIFFLFKRTSVYQYILIKGICLFAILTYVPGVTANALGATAQVARVKNTAMALDALKPSGEIDAQKLGSAYDSHEETAYSKIFDGISYLRYHNPVEYSDCPTFLWSKKNEDDSKDVYVKSKFGLSDEDLNEMWKYVTVSTNYSSTYKTITDDSDVDIKEYSSMKLISYSLVKDSILVMYPLLEGEPEITVPLNEYVELNPDLESCEDNALPILHTPEFDVCFKAMTFDPRTHKISDASVKAVFYR